MVMTNLTLCPTRTPTFSDKAMYDVDGTVHRSESSHASGHYTTYARMEGNE